MTALLAARDGRGFEGPGTLLFALIIAAFAVAAFGIARSHPVALGALAGGAVAIGSIFYGGVLAGIPFAIAFALGSGLLGTWWAAREWGSREGQPSDSGVLAIAAAVGLAVSLAAGVVGNHTPVHRATVWADFAPGTDQQKVSDALATCGQLDGVSTAKPVTHSPLIAPEGTTVLRFTIRSSSRPAIGAVGGCVEARGASTLIDYG